MQESQTAIEGGTTNHLLKKGANKFTGREEEKSVSEGEIWSYFQILESKGAA